MGGFGEQYSELQKFNTRIIAASTDNIENSTDIAADLPFPVAHSVTREQGLTLDSWWEDRRGFCLLYTSPSPRDRQKSRMPSSA